MIYLNSVTMKDAGRPADFPFTLPLIEQLERLEFTTPVTFFVGENGSGKSTLLEALAVGQKCPALGSRDTVSDHSLEPARALAAQLRFSRSRAAKRKLFFRAEDAIGFTRRIEADMKSLSALSDEYGETLTGYGRQLAQGAVQGQREALISRYGPQPDARSHGEWFLELMRTRLHPDGLYLFDEPETPLSPIHQLTLLSLIREMVSQNCQFIIATHSPMLMALPGARILEFGETISEVAWDEVEHVALTRAFLQDPDSFLRHL
ncbi:MAG: AAA family ATPase [Pseudomonadales bacterium]|nr:AAA family ATPase [Pseudomonadales bacterium]